VVKFVFDHRPDLAAPEASAASAPALPAEAPAPEVPAPTAAPPSAGRPAPATLEDADRFPARIPVATLRPPLGLCKATGVRLETGMRVVVGMDRGGVSPALIERLNARGLETLALDASLPADELVERVSSWNAERPVGGVFWLPALDAEPALSEMDLGQFRAAARVRVKGLYASMRALYGAIAGPGSFLVVATRLGGLHGQGSEGASAPLGGAVTGFAKAYRRERPDALVKAVDFGLGEEPGVVADALLVEATTDPGVLEVGLREGLRFGLGLAGRPAAARAGLALGKDSVFLVTGAAGGITSAIVADLAAASGGSFYLLDLVPEPRADDPRIALFRTDRERLKSLLIEEARSRGERPTPVQIEGRLSAVERDEAALRALESVRAAGGVAHWRRVDLLDAEAVSAVVRELFERHARLDVLVHAAGLEVSRRLSEKEPQEFDRVFDVKADGFFNLLRACHGFPLGASVAFGSVAGRFGNAGQTDYSAANGLLASMTASLRVARPETRAIAIDWTAWGAIGMATRGSIPTLMQQAGIELLPPEAGVPTVRRELTRGHAPGEVVVAGRLGTLAAELDATGGLDVDAARRALAEGPALVMLGEPVSASPDVGLVVDTTLDPRRQPFLFDHQIDGIPILPGVMGTEAFAELGRILAPGFRLVAVEDEEFLAPFKFHRQQPATLRLLAKALPGGAGELLADVELRSLIKPRPDVPVQEKLNFRARLRLARDTVRPGPAAFREPARDRLAIGPEAIYSVFFHGPAYRVAERVGIDGSTAIGLMAEGLPPDTAPADAELVTQPRLLELCFQTAGVWEIASRQQMGLPTALRRARFHGSPREADGRRLYAVVEARDGGQAFDARVVDADGRIYVELEGYRTVSVPGARSFAA
jgi:NAD(P)-dependent dehydrogenase (short-subunit alcohol dehydrogenase family)